MRRFVIIGAIAALGAVVAGIVTVAVRRASEATRRAAAETCGTREPAGLVALPGSPSSPSLRQLGEELFFDKRLSADETISCASCHLPERAFTDGRPTSIGAHGAVGERNAPTIFNAGYAPHFLWDGRAKSLEEQVKLALTNPAEMAVNDELIASRLSEQKKRFATFVGAGPGIESVSTAIAAFVRVQRSGNSRVDRYLFCSEKNSLSSQEVRGLELFSGEANCIRCHVFEHRTVNPLGGARAFFTDFRFHNIGAGVSEDRGRVAVTNDPRDEGAFKTPTLRDVVLTAPYMHDGSLKSLREVIDFYNKGGRTNPNLDPAIRPLNLKEDEIKALVVYLKALTGEHASPSPTRRERRRALR